MVKQLPQNKSAVSKLMKGVGLIVIGLVAAALVKSLMNFLESRLEGFADGASATVTYYSMDGCPHCKDMKPKWDKFKAEAAKSDTAIITKEYSADVDSAEIAKAVPKVSGFPTVHVSWKGKVTEYRGPREAEAIMAFVKKTMSS